MVKTRKRHPTGVINGRKLVAAPGLVNKLANSMPGKKARPARGRKLGNRSGAADSGVTVVQNPIFSSNAQVQDGVRTIDIVCQLNPDSLFRLINSWLQYYVVINGNTLVPGVDTTDFQDIAATMYVDLLNAMGGLISIFVQVDQPALYRDLFEAVSPKTTKMSPTVQTRYSWFAGSLPQNFTEVDGVHWGPQTNTEYYGTGQAIVGPYSGSSGGINAVKKLFNAMLAKGHRKWDGKPTAYANDTSAFAMYEPDNNNNVPSDFANCAGMSQHEQPIKFIWVAGLQLVTVSNDRFPRFFKALYSGPQTQMGHRLINILSGQQAAMEQTTVQRVDYTEFQYQVQGILSGIFSNAFASAGDSLDELNALFNSIDNTAWQIYLQNCIATAALLESPATLGYQDPFSTYVPIPFGTQFIPRDPTGTTAYRMFILVIENLRRLKVVATKMGRVGDMFFYNSFSMSPPLFTTFSIFPGLPGPVSAWPTSYDVPTATDNVSNVIVSLNMAGIDALSVAFGYLSDFMAASAPFTKISDQTAEREMSGQQLTNLIRFVAPTPAARLGGLPAVDQLKRAGSIKKEGTKLSGKQLLIFQSIRKPKRSERLVVEDEPVTSAIPFSIGTQGAIGSRRPFNALANKFYSCVIPITYIQLAPVGGTLMNAIAPAVSKLSVYSFWPVDSLLSSYYNNLMLQGLQTTYRAESSTTPIELLQIFQNHADAGLGGAAGDLTRMLFGFAKKDKWKKMGDALAPIVDGVANAFPRTRKLNNMMSS